MAEEFKMGTVDEDGVNEEKTAFETGIRESQREKIPTLKGEEYQRQLLQRDYSSILLNNSASFQHFTLKLCQIVGLV